jgi:proprotein convertase subtilisin/kexin type 5
VNCVPQWSCPQGQYADQTYQQCMPCPEGCAYCNQQGFCYFCENGYYYDNEQCLSVCPDGFYSVLAFDTAANQPMYTCKACNYRCATCKGALSSQCTQCPSRTFLYRGQCLTSCPTAFFADLQANKCFPCPQGCTTCKNLTTCTTCVAGMYLITDTTGALTCQTQCVEGFYEDDSSASCQPCALGCLACSG